MFFEHAESKANWADVDFAGLSGTWHQKRGFAAAIVVDIPLELFGLDLQTVFRVLEFL
jgi:hypothetical protein